MRDPDAGILASELRHVIGSLQRLIGAPLHDAWMPAPGQLVLAIGRDLLLIEHEPVPRVHTVAGRPRNPTHPFSFQGLVRARVSGPLTALRMVGDDRIVELVFGLFTVHARLFGRGGGIWLLDGDKVIGSAAGPAPELLPPLPAGAPRATPPRFSPVDGDWDRGARDLLVPLAEREVVEAARRRVRTHLGTLLARERRLVANLSEDLGRADRAGALRDAADGLAAVLHTVPRGARSVDVPDLSRPGVTIHVELDPSKPASATMGKLYDKAGRLDRASSGILERLDAAETKVRALEEDRRRVDEAGLDTLDTILSTWKPAQVRPKADAPAAPFRTWTGPNGQVVHVGRNDKGNHALVFRHSRGRDWWLHVRDRPGAHVVIPMPHAGDAPPLDRLLDAAQVALAASGVRVGEAFDVIYARVSDVRPIKGHPGKVTVRDERVLHVRREVLNGWSVA